MRGMGTMWRSVALGMLLVCSGAAVAGCGWAAKEVDAAVQAAEYRALRDARSVAYAKRDRGFYEQLLSDDFVVMDAAGRLLDKDGYLDLEFAPGRAGSVSSKSDVSDFRGVRTGDTLVLTYEERVTNTVGAQTFTEHSRRLDVYVRQGGMWKLRAMTGAGIPETPAAIALDAAALAAYSGTYEFAAGVVSVVKVDGDHLAEQTTGQPPTVMRPMAPDLFFDPGSPEARIAFMRDASGRVNVQVYRAGSQEMRARRVD